MPLSRLDNLVPMSVPINIISPLSGLRQCRARGPRALCFRCTVQRCPSARMTNGRNSADFASRLAAGTHTTRHTSSERFAAVPPARAPIAQGLGLSAARHPFACRRS